MEPVSLLLLVGVFPALAKAVVVWLGGPRTIIGTVVFIVLPIVLAIGPAIWVDHSLWVPGLLGSLLATGALVLAIRRERSEVVGLAMGLAYGGLLWVVIIVVVLKLPGEREALMPFLRGHAFDYFAAGGLVAAVWYVSLKRAGGAVEWPRVVWLAGVMALVGSVTAFTAKADSNEIWIISASSALGGALLGGVPVPDYLEAFEQVQPAFAEAIARRGTVRTSQS